MRFIAITLLTILAALGASQEKAQETAPPDKSKAKRVLPPPTNLKVLKVTTGPEVGQIMRTFTTGLGVQCGYCHEAGNYASDSNPKKDVARHMITMTQTINGNFENKLRVSCYTCHRGEPEPKTAPEPKPAQ